MSCCYYQGTILLKEISCMINTVDYFFIFYSLLRDITNYTYTDSVSRMIENGNLVMNLLLNLLSKRFLVIYILY